MTDTESIKSLEETHGWSISSASSSPCTVTMTYKSQLELFFHPGAFQTATQGVQNRPNAPISLSYIATDRNEQPKALSTTLRFFLQLLRASLHALPECSTRTSELLHLVSSGWETALMVAEAERKLEFEGMTDCRIVNDERLAIESVVLLPKVRTKVCVSFELLAAIGEGLELSMTVEPKAKVVYGQPYDEKKMTGAIAKQIGDGFECWAEAVRDLRSRLIAQGTKGLRR